MVDLLPAGLISHGLYGGSTFVQNQPTGQMNSWGVLRPGAPLKFNYVPATVGAGFIACEGKRVCGATMTSDGFGRWAVPSARDLADVLNMVISSNHSYAQYFDMTVDKIFERMNVLGTELHRVNLAVSRGGNSNVATPQESRPCSARPEMPVVQGQVVAGEVQAPQVSQLHQPHQPQQQWQTLPPAAGVQVRAPSAPSSCMAGMGQGVNSTACNATQPGAWEAMKAERGQLSQPNQPTQHIPVAPPKRPQTAARPTTAMDRRAVEASAVQNPWPTTPRAMPGASGTSGPPPGTPMDMAAELERCAARQPWTNGRRQLPQGGR